ALLLGAGTLLGKAEVGVHNQGGGERVSSSKGGTVSLALPVARIAAASDRYPLQSRAESRWREIRVVQKTEPPEHVGFAAYVPVDLAIDGVTEEPESARGIIVIADTRQVRLWPEAVNLLRNLP